MDKSEDNDNVKEMRKLLFLKNECESLEKEIKYYASSAIDLKQSLTSITGSINALRASMGDLNAFLISTESHALISIIKSVFSNSFSKQNILEKRNELEKIEINLSLEEDKKLRVQSSLKVTEMKRNELLGVYDRKKREYQKVSSSIVPESDDCFSNVNNTPVVKVKK